MKLAHSAAMHSAMDEILGVLHNLIKGGDVDKPKLAALYETVKSAEDLRRPINLKQELLSDKRYSAETGTALYSLIADLPFSYPPGTTDYRVRPSISTFPQQHVLSRAQTSWTFDPFELTMQQPLASLAMYLINGEQLIKRLRLDRRNLFNFFCVIESKYQDVHYHNAFHACAVLQYMHVLLTQGSIKDKLRLDDQTLLACYIAALAHDVGHQGVTNDFLIKSNDELAVTYNDISPLENFHAAECIRCMRRQNCNFIQSESSIDYFKFKTLICKLILATDVRQHFQLLSLFTDTDDSQDCIPCLQMTIKCADMSHLCSPVELHKQWVHRLEQEFLKQGDVERLRGMPVGLMMDRTKKIKLSDTQVGFFEVVAVPMFRAVEHRYHDALPMLQAAETNMRIWQKSLPPAPE